MHSGFFYNVANGRIFFFKAVLYIPHFLCPFICLWQINRWTVGFFHIFAIMNNTTMNTGVQASLQDSDFSSFGIYRLLDHMVVVFFTFLRTLHTVFHSCCIILLSHQQCTRVPILPHPCQYLLLCGSVCWFVLFLIIAILTDQNYDMIPCFSFDLYFPDN